jgi:hypothetical protein
MMAIVDTAYVAIARGWPVRARTIFSFYHFSTRRKGTVTQGRAYNYYLLVTQTLDYTPCARWSRTFWSNDDACSPTTTSISNFRGASGGH